MYLNVGKDCVIVSYSDPSKKDDKKYEVRSKEEFVKFLTEHEYDYVLSSSELDFPTEYTKDKKIVKLCDWIRNNG